MPKGKIDLIMSFYFYWIKSYIYIFDEILNEKINTDIVYI